MSLGTIGFIGGGNMASSLIGGLIAHGCEPSSIVVSDTDAAKLASLEQRFGITRCADNAEAAGRADTVVFAVKPQGMGSVVREVAEAGRTARPLFVSIAAGVRASDIARWLAYDAAIVRTMPNTPALVRNGATALFANAFVSDAERERAETIMGAVGLTLWVEQEDLLDAVTAVSGSGPAYFFLLMELMEEAGASLGLPREDARALTLQTALGAARMAIESGEPPATLRANVTSPQGTTERAINTFIDGGLDRLVRAALHAARRRAVELGEALGKD
ncbi:MAG: pyrroline-5-carboxylate reductase [Gammaproteobacteria bacterium]|nr:pyrroline-5-carboxylate reductase [Gammaproteobacteria bacterium]